MNSSREDESLPSSPVDRLGLPDEGSENELMKPMELPGETMLRAVDVTFLPPDRAQGLYVPPADRVQAFSALGRALEACLDQRVAIPDPFLPPSHDSVRWKTTPRNPTSLTRKSDSPNKLRPIVIRFPTSPHLSRTKTRSRMTTQ